MPETTTPSTLTTAELDEIAGGMDFISMNYSKIENTYNEAERPRGLISHQEIDNV